MFRRARSLSPATVLLYTALICVGLLIGESAHASPLERQITELVNRGLDKNITRTITLLTPEKQRDAICENPVLSLSGNDTRLAGNRSVIAQCGTERKFLQIAIKAEGRWWVANRTLAAGATIEAGDIKQQQGSMDRLPAGTMMNKDDIIGRVTTRAINAGQPVQTSQLRQNWAITAGENVEIQLKGAGFLIRTSGKAVDNAALNENVRIKTSSGQMVTGKVLSAGKVLVSAQH
ncbi:flagella basal body P-ring formation protein FlgA [Citrobacter amalonaticus]|uniref:Flagella basal body P-ring formation protein FlgA n=1 Tax=Citrobacter amalonaticus TaxID=35703 RepID=A0A2S4RRD1_CITAM|nr:flagellar basal body P-ring formation chaperone FlgA [Citrobacter amalonaticus]POT54742.1 flagella basal body P-ring formation protein FlgA [Citrobacter amalonaticus]POT69950.1 flagella basal body P-ring formation protein FlgA [Citrobacter amalonaticus]POU61209.1 flagella basal body P-ring formation protein FlgA [Citrobacter amalonaticus]POV02563.1 flagella basal body P-ring formation protein FlgA [Citrobacter amalonaticus]